MQQRYKNIITGAAVGSTVGFVIGASLCGLTVGLSIINQTGLVSIESVIGAMAIPASTLFFGAIGAISNIKQRAIDEEIEKDMENLIPTEDSDSNNNNEELEESFHDETMLVITKKLASKEEIERILQNITQITQPTQFTVSDTVKKINFQPTNMLESSGGLPRPTTPSASQ